jgi:hypothetical protein
VKPSIRISWSYALAIGATRDAFLRFGLSLAMFISERSIRLPYDVYSTCWRFPRASTGEDH